MMTATPERRELHLHVGLPKTGTSYVQACLPLNRAKLAACGFSLAPLEHSNLGAHHDLYLLEEREGPEAMAAVLARAEGDRMVASSEYFSRMLRQPARLRALARALRPHFDVTVHVVLRRQDFQKESGYAQSAKVARMAPISAEADPAGADEWSANFSRDPDYALVVGNLEDAFGAGALRVAVYAPKPGGDLFDDFCRLLGVSLDDPVRAPRVNESISRRRTLFVSHMRKPDERLGWFALEVISRTRFIADDGGKFLLSPADRRRVVEHYLEGNRRVVARHAPEDGEALLTLPDDEPDWFPAAPIRTTEFLMVAVTLARAALRNWRRRVPGRLRDAALLTALCLEAAVRSRRIAGGRRP